MDNYLDSLKTPERKELEKFFGYIKNSSTNTFRYNAVQSNGDYVIVLTNNIADVKGKTVLMVSPTAGIYLQDWQYRKVESKKAGLRCYAVKLSRKFFKPYDFKYENNNFVYLEDGTDYDSWLRVAMMQQQQKFIIKEGWASETS